MPDGENAPDNQRRPNGHIMTAQGSGFFITADGYAVTNNHVVDKAKAVEITTDDGKTYDAELPVARCPADARHLGGVALSDAQPL
jgi:serine protease Do